MRRLFLFLPFLLLLALSFSGRASAEQSPWHLRLSLPSGEINDAVFATESDVWAVGPAGVFLSGDSGKSWQFVDVGQSLSAVDAAPGGVYGWAVTDTGIIMATADSGRTWSYQQSGTAMNLVDVDALSDKVAYVFGRGAGLGSDFDENPRILLKTADGGQTWSEVKLDPGYKLESMDFLDDGQHGWLSVTITGGHALLKTSDGGASWITVNSEGQRYFDQMQFLTPEVGWAHAVSCFISDCGPHALARTLNGGATWQEVLPLDGYGALNPFYAFNDKSAVVARIGLTAPNSWWNRGVMRTDDGGVSWSAVAQGERESTKVLTAWDESHGIRVREWISPSADEVMWTADNRIWQDADMPVTSGYSLNFINSYSGWAAGARLLRTEDGGLNWQTVSDMRFGSVDFVSQDVGWATQYGCNTVNALCGQFVFRTKDGGATWQQLNSEVNGISETKFFDANHGWGDQGSSSSSQIMHTDDGGLTWKGAAHMTGMFPAYVDSNVAWVANPPYFGLSAAQSSSMWPDKMYVQLTSDGGATTQSNSFEAPGFCGNLAIAATDASSAWLVWQKCDGNQATLEVQRTTDAGASWQTLSPLPLQDIFNAKFFDSSHGTAAGLQCNDQGQCQDVLLRTNDGGASWALEPTGLVTKRPDNALFWSPSVKYQFLDPQHIWRVGWRTSAAVEEIYSYDVSAAPASSIIMPVTDLGPESSAGGAPPSSIIMPPTGSGLESSTSGALYAAFLAAMFGAATLALGARLRRRSR